MSFISAPQEEKIGYHDGEDEVPFVSNLPTTDDVNMEVEVAEEEDEDVDFNPFMRGDSPSAASFLSSEDEGPVGNGKDAGGTSRLPEEIIGYEDERSVIMKTTGDGKDDFSGNTLEKTIDFSMQQGGELTPLEGSKDLSSRSDDNGKRILQTDDEDAICRRTRARQSLVNYTLEELETFLQESDDDCDPPNVDDEEEYRKFLAAVLLQEDDDEKEGEGGENTDEDEDNDSDFKLEIEGALESDADEGLDNNRRRDVKQKVEAHMPVTRQKKRLKESAKNKKDIFGPLKMPLRPLVPYESTMQNDSSFPTHGWKFTSPIIIPQCSSSACGVNLSTGFTAQQIGQLYSLMHEHVQLLIQVFSVSVLDHSKHEVAGEVQKMILEMDCRREEALRQRKIAYPNFCFHRSYLQPSLLSDLHLSANGSYYTPLIDSPVLSVLDVAPLRLVKSFMTDVSDTISRYRRSHVEDVSDKSHLKREPLFPLLALDSNSDKDTSGETTTMYSHARSPRQDPPDQRQSKRSIASMLVENAKSEPVALVPKDIARSAQRFYPLFNATLFPRKPPVLSVANRMLFTDAEDGLLAMGLMQYNNDWAAIQKNFLPCKSTHQIFVRQKNRSSSKAPENPIKAVRRMKTSPLTPDEKARIYEGLRLLKNDWFSVWKFIVPYKDPSLLPRLWRIATGTQKSYGKNAATKEKQRLYDTNKRKMKASTDQYQMLSNKEVDNEGDNGAGDVDGEDAAYVHEAFLADSENGSSKNVSGDAPLFSIDRNSIESFNIMTFNGGHAGEPCYSIVNRSGERWQKSGHKFQNPARSFHPPSHCSQVLHSASSKKLSYHLTSRANNIHLVSQPLHTHESKGFRVVKLAPDLPPVNLPPSVRVISQSAFKSCHIELPASAFSDTAEKDHVLSVSQHTRGSDMINSEEHSQKKSDNGLDSSLQQDTSACACHFGAEENTSESDLQMHPLLFQSENRPTYTSINIHDVGSATHNSFPRNPPQAESCLSKSHYSVRSDLFDNAAEKPEKATSDLQTIDFHPLFRRASGGRVDFASRSSHYQLSRYTGVLQGNDNKSFDQSDYISRITASPTHNDEENNLDLDIRLCSAPHKEKALGREIQDVLAHRILGKDYHGNITAPNSSHGFPQLLSPSNLSLQAVPPATSGGCHSALDFHDDSIPGIVMNHEELSDSEENIENVEFECEEIDDSEDDEMGVKLRS